MSDALDMSLDDLIKKNKKDGVGSARGGRGGGRAVGPGPARRFPVRAGGRSAPYYGRSANLVSRPFQVAGTQWQHDLYSETVAGYHAAGTARASAIETGTKLYISNLDYGVSNEDVKELFSDVGDLKRFSVHYDRSGRSKGTAEVVFSRRADALAAVKRYNNIQLDGKPMKIEIVGTNIVPPPAPVPQFPNVFFVNPNALLRRSGPGRGASSGLPRGGDGRGRGRGREQGRGRGNPPSAADLDADLDKYHSEALRTK